MDSLRPRTYARALVALWTTISLGLLLTPLSGCLFVAGRRSNGHWFFWPIGLLIMLPFWFGMRRRR